MRAVVVFLGCLVVVSCLSGRLVAEEEWRTWTSTSGTTLEAKWLALSGDRVTLERREGGSLEVKLSQLSAEDRSFARQAAERASRGEPRVAGIAAEPGQVSAPIRCEDDERWSYHLYLPRDFHDGRLWPVCFVTDPGGGKPGTLVGYRPAADRLGLVLAVSIESRNGFEGCYDAQAAMVTDVYERLPVIPGMAMSSGMSGGSRMAYYAAESYKDVTGVLACGSGAGVYLPGGSFREARLDRDTVVCSLIGTNDFNRRGAVRTHDELGEKARLIWFPGNHDWAGPEWIEEGMMDVYGKMLARSGAQELDPLRERFAREQLAWTGEQKQPWVRWRWADFLKDFPGDEESRRAAAEMAETLATDPQVVRAREADEELRDFARKFFREGSFEIDAVPDPAREREAAKWAGEFDGLPHAEWFKLLGAPSPPP